MTKAGRVGCVYQLTATPADLPAQVTGLHYHLDPVSTTTVWAWEDGAWHPETPC